MESTAELMKGFQKRDMGGGTVAPPAPAPAPDRESNEAHFVKIRRKGLANADSPGIEQKVTLEALLDKNGLVGLSG